MYADAISDYQPPIVYTDIIDERIMRILANKQRIFDAFADRSVAAEQAD